ncbi:carbohydrate esterase family 9 protein [Hysterangium stoloniferum]|nr:carbohydrate esterase family 9 protein [Hysterangium stoloniferum]
MQWQSQAKPRIHRRVNTNLFTWAGLVLSTVSLWYIPVFWNSYTASTTVNRVPINAAQVLSRCAQLDVMPGVPAQFQQRTQSDRFEEGTPPTLIYNATIWTGSDNQVVRGDVLLDGGIIKRVGGYYPDARKIYGERLVIVDAKGAWVTPGIVDLHSHLGVNSAPSLSGASDGNSHHGITQPKLKSLDGLNTHDDAFVLSVSGGITSANVLPGSANAIGGQAFPIKLRPTSERSASSKLIEQPGSPTSTGWRQMNIRYRHACGENPSRRYEGTRMDTIWSFRAAYDKARKLVNEQDKFCAAAKAFQWADLKGEDFPDDLEWEALADVIRGKVKVHNHCYEAVDFDGIVRLSNEFKFPIAAFHHAHEAYLVPELINKAWGETPAIAIFATNGRYKREAYRGSEFAPRIIADSGLRVVMKSDHPVMNSRYLLFDAQQAYYYGLDANTALTSITTTPATVMGLGHRIGFVNPGYDADIVIWDSHPLALGATPKQVFIDGIAQFSDPHVVEKPATSQGLPARPNFDKEIAETIKYEGLPPLNPLKNSRNVIFENVKQVWARVDSEVGVEETFSTPTGDGVVVVEDGQIKCTGLCEAALESDRGYEKVDLKGGSLAPGFLAFGSPLGINVINGEASTKDGAIFDPLTGSIPSILGGDGAVIKAVDGLQFETRDALLAYRSGVTTAVSAPVGSRVFAGLGTHFSTGASNKLEIGAVVHKTTALHLKIGYTSNGSPSVSSQIATLRRLLLGYGEGDQKATFEAVTNGKVPLVISVESADIMATLMQLKEEVEGTSGTSIQMTFAGGSEAHLIAQELGKADVGVILFPVRPFPKTWERRRVLPGPPITEQSAVAALVTNNVTVGLGVVEAWEARNSRFDAAWVALETGISQKRALSMVSSNLEKLLGAQVASTQADIVAYQGGDVFESSSKVIAVISPRRHLVDFL